MKNTLTLFAALMLLGGTFYATLLSASDVRKVSEFEIEIRLDQSTGQIKLVCREGCAWESATFPCGPGDRCTAGIDGRGIVTPLPRSD